MEAKDLLLSLKLFDLGKIVTEELKRSRLFKWRATRIMVRMGIINRRKLSIDELKRVERGLLKAYRDSVVGKETLRELLHDKVDLEGLRNLVNNLDKMEVIARPKFSKQSLWALENECKAKEVSVNNSTTILNMVRRRLENREVRLVCMFCGHEWIGKVKDVPLKCPKCGVGFIAPSFNEEMIIIVAKKIANNVKLRKEERRTAEEVRERANLLMAYGRNALLTLAARGVGAKTAKRILARSTDGHDLVKEIVQAEKTYIKTRRYW
jgi:ATP-dependent Lhr-like helicase